MLNIFTVSLSSNLNKLKALSARNKSKPTGTEQNLILGFI